MQSGEVVKGRDSAWPFTVTEQKMPVNRRVLQLSATGAGQVVTDNTGAIGNMLGGRGSWGTPGTGSGGGCSVGGTTAGSAAGGLLLALALFGLVVRRRRSGR